MARALPLKRNPLGVSWRKGVQVSKNNDVVEMIIGETIYPFEKFGSGLYASGGVWHPFERAQQSVHLTAFGVCMLAILAGYVVFFIQVIRKFGGK